MKYLSLLPVLFVAVFTQELDHREIKCGVCKATIQEMETAIAKVDPNKKVEVGGFRISSNGEATSKKIPLVKSEMYLTELMESVCDKMDDYARARFKKNGKLVILKLITDGGMNPLMSEVDFVQDADLNKSLKHLCLEVLEEHDESIVQLFMEDEPPKDAEYDICTKTTGFCNDTPIGDDYELEHEEL